MFSHLFDGCACDVTTQLWKAQISIVDLGPPECLNVEAPCGVVVMVALSGWGSAKVEQFYNRGSLIFTPGSIFNTHNELISVYYKL